MKFLIGYSVDHGFLVGELDYDKSYDSYFSFCCDGLLPCRESGVDYNEIADVYWEELPAEDKLCFCEANDCSPYEARQLIREDKPKLINFDFDVDISTMPNVDDDIFYDLVCCGQHDPREDDPILFIPETLFNRIMTDWDSYHLKDSREAWQEYTILTNAISACGFDNKETWREFVVENIVKYA